MKPGNRVFDIRNGWGEVIELNHTDLYPVVVRFDIGEVATYTMDGKAYIYDLVPMLSHEQYMLVPL